MNKIIEKTYELIDVLDNSDLINKLVLYRGKIINNDKITDLVKRGNSTDDKYLLLDIKRELYKNEDYKNYIDKYNELMYIVMNINSRYNKLLGKGSCYK